MLPNLLGEVDVRVRVRVAVDGGGGTVEWGRWGVRTKTGRLEKQSDTLNLSAYIAIERPVTYHARLTNTTDGCFIRQHSRNAHVPFPVDNKKTMTSCSLLKQTLAVV